MTKARWPGRIRSIHPSQWDDADFLDLSYPARLFLIALRNFADDNGIFEWHPKQLKIRAMPGDNEDVEKLLTEAVNAGMVRSYEDDDGKKYGIIKNWIHYQSPRTPSLRHPIPTFAGAKGFEMRHLPTLKDEKCEDKSCKDRIGEGRIEEEGKAVPGLSRSRDPLENYPMLIALHKEFREFISLLYPKMKSKQPKPGTDAYRKERVVLSQLVRCDKYSENEIVNVIRWVFTSPDNDAEFWRGNVMAITPLRNAKPGEPNKFAKIEAAMNRPGNTAAGTPAGNYGTEPGFGSDGDE